MWLKFLLVAFFVLSLLGAFVLAPRQKLARSKDSELTHVEDDRRQDNRRLRLLTWNIGNGDLESDTRAHTKDLRAVAEVIKKSDPDAVALQELSGKDQLTELLAQLQNDYRGYVCNPGSSDRTDAVLIKNNNASNARKDRVGRGRPADGHERFDDLPAGERFAAAATFHLSADAPAIVLVSAHADAFSARRRRVFVAEVVDWSRSRSQGAIVFIAGDFNFEVSVRKELNLFTDDAKHDSESYAYLLKYFRDLGRDAGETSINDRRIDYVFGPPETGSPVRAEVLRGAGIGRMDHWPLLVEVALSSS
jgi:endonuclease/exonuclease/phosphatase family metal-dependent hydrolase